MVLVEIGGLQIGSQPVETSMHIDYLVRMANDIGSFFASETDQNVAAESIHLHLKRFWDPRMRGRIIGYFNETNGVDLEGPVRTAVQQLAQEAAATETAAKA